MWRCRVFQITLEAEELAWIILESSHWGEKTNKPKYLANILSFNTRAVKVPNKLARSRGLLTKTKEERYEEMEAMTWVLKR